MDIDTLSMLMSMFIIRCGPDNPDPILTIVPDQNSTIVLDLTCIIVL